MRSSLSLLPLDPGFWQDDLDQQALDLLMADRAQRQLTQAADKNDWLSNEQLALRHSREIHSRTGAEIDRLWFSGLYRRAWNPLAGTRPVSRYRYRAEQDRWGQDWWDSFESLPPGIPLPSLFVDIFVETGAHYCWDIMLPHTGGGCFSSYSDAKISS